jgi:CheY-like chemotaxis protein
MATSALEFGTVSEFLSAVAWPIVTIVIVLVLLKPVRQLLQRDEVNLTTPGGFSISAKGQQVAAGALVNAAASRRQDTDADAVQSKVETASETVGTLSTRPRILWVDDRPSNNRYEKAALEALEISVDLSTSTDDALDRVEKDGPYDVIISDMGRPPDDRAGYTLLSDLRAKGDRTPCIIYASSRAPEHFDESVRRGALGTTNMPTELLDMVVQALRATRARQTPRA